MCPNGVAVYPDKPRSSRTALAVSLAFYVFSSRVDAVLRTPVETNTVLCHAVQIRLTPRRS